MDTSKSTGLKAEDLFARNRAWAASMIAENPDFFKSLASQQSPEYLWIGCSDSRVPANELLGMAPGELFVHRNIANVVVHSDLNALTVLQFAIDVLKVKHVIVCGHYGCSGVHRYLGEVVDIPARADRLCELNVAEQVINVAQTTVVRDAWERGQELTIHSWVYGLSDGLLRDLGMTVSSHEEIATKLEARLLAYKVKVGLAGEAGILSGR
jgi:carbonic anhydrase